MHRYLTLLFFHNNIVWMLLLSAKVLSVSSDTTGAPVGFLNIHIHVSYWPTFVCKPY